MPASFRLPRGAAASRGVSSVRHLASLGGQLAQKTNQLYMLTVRRESFKNKRDAILNRLKEVEGQLKGIEKDLRTTEQEYQQLKKKNRSKNGGRTVVDTEEKGFGNKGFKMEY